LVEESAQANRLSISTNDAIAEVRRLLDAAVNRQLVSDVPVGVFLSGGVDSSTITAIASKHYRGRLATYSAGFDDRDGVDERPKARRVAARFGTDHHEFFIAGSAMPGLVEKMVQHHDLPFSDSANIPLYLMAKEIASSTKVVLQGDGGDELFAGYRRYVTLRRYRLLSAFARLSKTVPIPLSASPFLRRLRRYMNAFAAAEIGQTMALLLTPIDPASAPDAIFSGQIRSELQKTDPFARYRECQRLVAHDRDVANQMSLVDLMIELPDVFLEKVDRATMAASLEVRVPFLDHDLVDFVVRLPGDVKLKRGKKKWLLKRAVEGLVPEEVLRAPKTGFNVPFAYWLRTSLKPLFFDHMAQFERERPGVLDRLEIERRYAALQRGEHDRAFTLWNLLNLMIWCNQKQVDLVAGARTQSHRHVDSPVGIAAHS
jgi:asparagine synthase (glutamine-hydrolysing)